MPGAIVDAETRERSFDTSYMGMYCQNFLDLVLSFLLLIMINSVIKMITYMTNSFFV